MRQITKEVYAECELLEDLIEDYFGFVEDNQRGDMQELEDLIELIELTGIKSIPLNAGPYSNVADKLRYLKGRIDTIKRYIKRNKLEE